MVEGLALKTNPLFSVVVALFIIISIINRYMKYYNSKEIKFIEKCKKVHNSKYDYSLVCYEHSHKKIKIICPVHGIFEQTAHVHSDGSGCKKCIFEDRSKSYLKFKSIDLIEKIILDNLNEKYKLISVLGMKYDSVVKLKCNIHGDIKIRLDTFLKKGTICRKCNKDLLAAKQTKSTIDYINECISVHGNRYDYSKTLYTGALKKSIFICKKHGNFKQQAGSHLKGAGCPKCRHRISKSASNWIKSFNNKNIIQEEYIEGKFVDGFDPTTNTIYEFYGDYWHGNPDIFNSDEYNKRTKCTMGELYQKTINRSIFLKSKGFNLIEIWENDFKEKSRSSSRRPYHD